VARGLSCAGVFLLVLIALPRLTAATRESTEEATEAATEASAEEAIDANADQKLLLEVQINGRSIGKIGEFTLRRAS